MTKESVRSVIEKFVSGGPAIEWPTEIKSAVEWVVLALNEGRLRVAEPIGNQWQVHAWVKKSVLLYFQLRPMEKMELSPFYYMDKIPLKEWDVNQGVRCVPGAIARYGSYIAPQCVLMPSFVNIGAYVGEGTMIDTWATVGSCAQIGARVHLSGGVGIGGVLEPLQAQPVIIEDDVFVGSRSIIVEGVRVGERAVIAAGVTLTGSTPIIDVTGPTAVISKGVVPAHKVVIPGSRSKDFPAGSFQVPCALIIGERNSATDQKTSLNQALRDFEVPI